MAVSVTNNARFKEGYGRYVRYSLGFAIAFHILLFYLFPSFTFSPYELEDAGCILELLPSPKVEILPAPPEATAPQPVIEEAAVGEPTDDVDWYPNVYREFDEILEPSVGTEHSSQEFYVFDRAPELAKYAAPVYPELMRQAGIEGTVNLLVLVGEDGSVLEVSVLRSDVTPVMERAAVEAAKRFLFRPAMQGSYAVRARMMVPVVFSLH